MQDRLLAVVNVVYAKYREKVDRQHRTVSLQIDVPLAAPEPQSRLQFVETGLELSIRYPVDIRDASRVDEEITRTVLETIAGDAGLKASVSGSPKIRSAATKA